MLSKKYCHYYKTCKLIVSFVKNTLMILVQKSYNDKDSS